MRRPAPTAVWRRPPEGSRAPPTEAIVAEAATAQGLDPSAADALTGRWAELTPWPEAPEVLHHLSTAGVRLGAVTNCSDVLGRRAADQFGDALDLVVTSEAAGAYKPSPQPYELALAELDLPPDRVLFVAGSKFDIPGASGVGMPVWWHNRVHIERGDLRPPIAEHDTLTPLVGHALAYCTALPRPDIPATRM